MLFPHKEICTSLQVGIDGKNPKGVISRLIFPCTFCNKAPGKKKMFILHTVLAKWTNCPRITVRLTELNTSSCRRSQLAPALHSIRRQCSLCSRTCVQIPFPSCCCCFVRWGAPLWPRCGVNQALGVAPHASQHLHAYQTSNMFFFHL